MKKQSSNSIDINILIAHAIDGDSTALSQILNEVNDFVFNLSLRMLGTIADAEDAILIKIITNLSSFKMNSKFETWVYRIASNYLVDYKKSMFAQYPLDFSYYANDIKFKSDESIEHVFEKIESEQLANELKLSCTNVMLQCLTPVNRCIFILGTMFEMNSQLASEILDMTPQNYRKRLSRSRKKMQEFLFENCGLAGGSCKCINRIHYAITCTRLNPDNLEYSKLTFLDKDLLDEHKSIMEDIEEQVDVFKNLSWYHSTLDNESFIRNLLSSNDVIKLLNFTKEELQ